MERKTHGGRAAGADRDGLGIDYDNNASLFSRSIKHHSDFTQRLKNSSALERHRDVALGRYSDRRRSA